MLPEWIGYVTPTLAILGVGWKVRQYHKDLEDRANARSNVDYKAADRRHNETITQVVDTRRQVLAGIGDVGQAQLLTKTELRQMEKRIAGHLEGILKRELAAIQKQLSRTKEIGEGFERVEDQE